MSIKKLLSLGLAISMCAAMFTGCGQEAAPAPEEPAPEGSEGTAAPAEKEYRDTIIFGASGDQNYMDGQMNNTNDVYLRTIYSQLVRRAVDGSIEGDLAESWETSEDGLTWTFHLRKGVKFHSGKELTSEDVKASYDRLLNMEDPVRYSALATGYIKECLAPDPYTVQLVTKTPVASMLANLCHRSNLILNKDYIEKYGHDLGLTLETLDGTGPYKMVEWERDQEMKLERNEDYYRGPVATKNIDIVIIPDKNTRFMAVQTGEIDVTGVSADTIAEARANPDLNVMQFDSIGSYGWQFNCANEYMKNPKVRQAISMVFDRQAMVDNLIKDSAAAPATAPINSRVWGYNDFGVIKQDKEKAKQLLAEAGYPDGFEIAIQCYTAGYVKSLECTEVLVQDLKDIGITATIEVVDKATFKSAMGNRTYPGENFPWAMIYMGFGAGTADADEGLRRIWQTSPDGNNNNNYGWYSNERVDELLVAAVSEMDPEKRKEMYKEAEQILFLDDPAAAWIFDGNNTYCMNKKVSGFQLNVNNAIFWDDLRMEK